MKLESIVKVNITRQTKAVSRAAFGTALFLAAAVTFEEVTRVYEDYDGVEADEDFLPASVLEFAARYFGQTLTPTKLIVGKRTTKVAQVETLTVTQATDGSYTVTIDGTEFEFVASGNTEGEIRDGLVAAINGGSVPVTAAASSTAALTLTADVAGNAFTSVLSAGISKVETTANNGVKEDIAAAKADTDDWYALALESRNDDDIMNAAEVIEADRKIFGACSEAAGIIASTETDVAAKLKAKSYARTFIIYSTDQESYPEGAWLGSRLPTDPGSSTWKFKTLAGITPDSLTASQETNLKNKNANFYVTVAGVNITVEGKMASGEFIDIIHFCDWLEARMMERIYATLVNAEKVSFTDGGISVIEADVRAQLQQGVDVGGLDSFTVTVPKRSATDVADRTARTLKGIKFNGILAGAIHAIEIQGNVTV
jgi:hypothetical protein